MPVLKRLLAVENFLSDVPTARVIFFVLGLLWFQFEYLFFGFGTILVNMLCFVRIAQTCAKVALHALRPNS